MSFFSNDKDDKKEKKEEPPVEPVVADFPLDPPPAAPAEVKADGTRDLPPVAEPPKKKHPFVKETVLTDEDRALIELERKAKEAEERVEADREHLRNMHGFFISSGVPSNVLGYTHEKDHAKEKHAWQYVPHSHQGGEVTVEGIPDGVPDEWIASNGSLHPKYK